MSARIVYKDLAVDAAESATVSATGYLELNSDLLLGDGADGRRITLERNRWILNGTFPQMPSAQPYCSDAISDDNGIFATPPAITVEFSKRLTSLGISLDFGVEDRCSRVTVEWYQGSVLLTKKTYTPDTQNYYCAAKVEAYDKIILTLERTALPHRRARLNRIIFGVVREFGIDELGDVRPIFEIDPTSRTLAENTLDWQLFSRENVEYIFQEKQPVLLYNNDQLLGTFYIQNGDRQAERRYQITCHDAIGVLDGDPWPDAVYINKNAYELAQEICEPFTIEMDDSLKTENISGYLKGKTRRQALQQLCFRLGAIADTEGSENIRIFTLRSYGATVIPAERTRLNGSVKTEDIVTKFSVLTHSLSATGSTNEVEIGGVKYYDTQVAHALDNPGVVSSDKPNVIDIRDATLVGESEADTILARLYDYYSKRQTFTLRFRVEDETVGDYAKGNTPWGAQVGGVLRRTAMSIKGKAVADAEIVGTIDEALDIAYPFSGDFISGQFPLYLGR